MGGADAGKKMYSNMEKKKRRWKKNRVKTQDTPAKKKKPEKSGKDIRRRKGHVHLREGGRMGKSPLWGKPYNAKDLTQEAFGPKRKIERTNSTGRSAHAGRNWARLEGGGRIRS